MSYTSLVFALFCLILLFVYYVIPKKFQWMVLLVGSIVFYLFSGVKYILYVVITAFTTYITAILAHKNKKEFAAKLPDLKQALSQDEVRAAIKKNENRGCVVGIR